MSLISASDCEDASGKVGVATLLRTTFLTTENLFFIKKQIYVGSPSKELMEVRFPDWECCGDSAGGLDGRQSA